MTIGEWSSVLALLETILKCGALLGGGLWVAYTFASLRQINRARADIASIELGSRKAEAELAKLAQESKVGAVVQVQLTATSAVVPGDSGSYLQVAVDVANRGLRNTTLVYKGDPLVVYSVALRADTHEFEYKRVATAHVVSGSNPTLRSIRLLIRAGGSQRLSFVVLVPGPGLYLVVFSVPIDEKEQEIAAEHGFERKGKWTAKEYVIVQKTAA